MSARASEPMSRAQLWVEVLRPHRWRLAAAAACVLASAVGQLAMPLLVGRGIDHGVIPGHRGVLLAIVAAFVFAALTDAAGQRLAIKFVGNVAENAIYALRTRLWSHVQGLSIDWFEREQTGGVVSRATTDVDAVYDLFSQASLALVSNLLTMSAIAVVLLVLDPVLGAVVLGVIPALAGATWVFKGRSEIAYGAVREKIALVLVHLAESLTGMHVVQAFTREPINLAQFEDVNGAHLAANSETVRLMSVYGPGVEWLSQIGVFLVLLVGGYRAWSGAITVGVLASFLLYVRQFFDPLQELSEFFNSWQRANAGLERISQALAATSTVPESRDARPLVGGSGGAGAEVCLEKVAFSYDQDPVLHGVDLTVPAGETFALVGPTGAGKSTIAKLVVRFYDPTAGRVLIDGQDLREVSMASLRRAVAIVPQEAFLFSGTVHDNIALGREGVSRDDVERAAAAVGAHVFIEALPQGYDTPVEARGARLSGGQRQLLSFARAWLADPRVLVLDEATSALDLRSERLIQRALTELLADRTAIVIAHRLSSIEVADRIAVADGGRLVEIGTKQELLALNGRFRATYERWVVTTAAGRTATLTSPSGFSVTGGSRRRGELGQLTVGLERGFTHP